MRNFLYLLCFSVFALKIGAQPANPIVLPTELGNLDTVSTNNNINGNWPVCENAYTELITDVQDANPSHFDILSVMVSSVKIQT